MFIADRLSDTIIKLLIWQRGLIFESEVTQSWSINVWNLEMSNPCHNFNQDNSLESPFSHQRIVHRIVSALMKTKDFSIGFIKLKVELEGRFCGMMEVMKEWRRRICWLMWPLAYWIQHASIVHLSIGKNITHLKPLQAVFKMLHAFLTYCSTDPSCFQENGLPPTMV